MTARAAYLAAALAITMPGGLAAQECAQAEASLKQVFDRHHARNDRFSGDQFAALSVGEKWFWTSSLLAAQIRRLDPMLQARPRVPKEKLDTAIAVFRALDAAEPCYRAPETDLAEFRAAWDGTARDRLRSEIEVLK